MRVLTVLGILAVTSSNLFVSTYTLSQQPPVTETSSKTLTPIYYGDPSQPGYQIQVAIYELAQEIISLDESKSMDDAVNEAVVQIVRNIETGVTVLSAEAVRIIVANKDVTVAFLTKIASLTVLKPTDTVLTIQPDTGIVDTAEADITEIADTADTADTAEISDTTETIETIETLVVVQTLNVLIETTKTLVDAQPDNLVAVLNLGFSLFPDSAQDIITGAELTGEITRAAAEIIAVSSGMDVSPVIPATSAGGNDDDTQPDSDVSEVVTVDTGDTGDTVDTGDTFDTVDTGDTVDTVDTVDTAAVDTPATTVDTPASTVDTPVTTVVPITTPVIAIVATPTTPVGSGAGAGGSGGGDSTASGS